MLKFRFAAPIIAALALATGVPAAAATVSKFDAASFEAAKAAGRPILVDVKAWWCPVCGSQSRTIKAAVTGNPAYDRLVIFEINYDGQKPDWRALGVQQQGTLIGYKGRNEVGRIAFQTDKQLINGLLSRIVG